MRDRICYSFSFGYVLWVVVGWIWLLCGLLSASRLKHWGSKTEWWSRDFYKVSGMPHDYMCISLRSFLCYRFFKFIQVQVTSSSHCYLNNIESVPCFDSNSVPSDPTFLKEQTASVTKQLLHEPLIHQRFLRSIITLPSFNTLSSTTTQTSPPPIFIFHHKPPSPPLPSKWKVSQPTIPKQSTTHIKKPHLLNVSGSSSKAHHIANQNLSPNIHPKRDIITYPPTLPSLFWEPPLATLCVLSSRIGR